MNIETFDTNFYYAAYYVNDDKHIPVFYSEYAYFYSYDGVVSIIGLKFIIA